MKNTQLVIPMTGLGQRFIDAGYSKLKPLIQVNGKSYIEHVLEMFNGIEDILFIISNDHPQKEYLREKLRTIAPNAVISEIKPHKLGPSYAINESSNFISQEKKVIVSYCDYKAKWNLATMIDQLDSYDGSILTYTGFHPHMMRSNKYAYVKKTLDLVTAIKEKEPFTDDPLSEEASGGCYGFKNGALLLAAIGKQLKENLSTNNEYYTSISYVPIINDNGKIATVNAEKFFQWGTPEDLEDFNYWQSAIESTNGNNSNRIKLKSSSTSIILAAGKGERIKSMLKLDKPNIPIAGKKLWEYSWEMGKHSQDVILVTRADIEIDLTGKDSVLAVRLNELTAGQAASTKVGLSKIGGLNENPIHVFSSDNVIEEIHILNATKLIEKCDLIVWVADNYPPSLCAPEQYSWAKIEKNNDISGTYEKKRPPSGGDYKLIVGNFTFRNKEIANKLIDSICEKNIKVNGEFYLDSVINEAILQGLKVEHLDVGKYFAIGTEVEYYTFNYFQH